MDGLTLTDEIRRREGGQRHTPIIAVTANGNREQCLMAGMDDYLAKPVRKQELADAIARCLNMSLLPVCVLSSPRPKSGAQTGRDAYPPTEDEELNRAAKGEDADAFSDAPISERLAQLREECGAEIVAGFIEMFVRDTAERLTRLHGLATQQDSNAVEREAHSLKGSCANLGVERMAAVCQQLEAEAEAGSLASTKEFLKRLDFEFERLKPLLFSRTEILRRYR